MWELDYEESWVSKNWCFWTGCWRRFLRVPWTARRSNQSILKISPGISLEGLMLKLKLQYFGHLMRRVDSLRKTLMLKGIGGRRRRDRGWDGWMSSLTWCTWVWVNSRSWWWTGSPGVLWFMRSQRVGHDWATELNWYNIYIPLSDLLHSVWWALVLSISLEQIQAHSSLWPSGIPLCVCTTASLPIHLSVDI